MSKITVPRYFIRHMFQPSGVRLEKFKKPNYWPYIPEHERKREQKDFSPPLALPESTYVGHNLVGMGYDSDRPDFDHADYQFWSVIGYTKIDNKPFPVTKCRCCEKMIVTRERRTKHHEAEGCSKVLTSAYEKLSRDGRCIMCDEKTAHRRFGLPICINPVCRKNWLELGSQPEALTNAILIVQLEKGDTAWNLC